MDDIAFIRNSAYIADGIWILLAGLSVIGGLAQLSTGRLPYPPAIARLRRHLPATDDDFRLEGLVVLLRSTALGFIGIYTFMLHLLVGQRPNETLVVIFWIATTAVLITAAALGRAAQVAGRKRRYIPGRPTASAAQQGT